MKDFRSAFAAARSQTEETEDKLKEYFERLKSWDEYFRLVMIVFFFFLGSVDTYVRTYVHK